MASYRRMECWEELIKSGIERGTRGNKINTRGNPNVVCPNDHLRLTKSFEPQIQIRDRWTEDDGSISENVQDSTQIVIIGPLYTQAVLRLFLQECKVVLEELVINKVESVNESLALKSIGK